MYPRALAETLRLNSTVTSLNLGANGLGEGGGRTLAETLRPNTTLTGGEYRNGPRIYCHTHLCKNWM